MKNKNPKFSITLQIVGGAYVIYTGISSMQTAMKGEFGIPFPAAIAISTVILVLGAVCLFLGLKGYKNLKDHPEEFEDPEETEEEE